MSSDSNRTILESGGPGKTTGVLAVAYVLVGIGFAYGLVAESTTVLGAALLATGLVVIGSLLILAGREGIVTAENKLIGTFVLLAMVLLVGLSTFTDVAFEVVFGLVVLVGVVAPGVLLQYTRYGRSE
ncbi:hypothetical protein [Halopiger xanaduensis]|uniref:Uncharacterized protein n=1 Tax=Halopiger xanaduensis (strain DSM 18323 / JCM 14033 / SH-6) TaxID=797210 RepID=F8D5T3_HALXS|nr:hypothetical protein [Halopiger xanaduensis]AEH36510.1 hypothetical protein Halxa_1883 [Halopiger xanaduensis SH-6]